MSSSDTTKTPMTVTQSSIETSVKNERSTTDASRKLSTAAWVALCVSLLLAEVQSAWDATATATLQPTIIHDLKEISKFPWISVAYTLGGGASCLLWGKLFAVFDSKKIFLLTRAFFACGSAIDAAAPSMNVFIVGKTLTGIGGGGNYIGVIVILTALTTANEQARYFGYIGFCWGLGMILGPLIGAAFAESSAGWRWSFYCNLIIVATTLPVFLVLLPSSKPAAASTTVLNRIRRLDLVGSITFIGALSSGVMAISFGGATYAWSSGQIIGLLCCSFGLWSLLALQQITVTFTTKEDRLLPIQVLKSKEIWILIVQISSAISALYVSIYYLPLYFQFVKGEGAIRSGVDSLPFLITSVVVMLVSGRLIASVGWYKAYFIAGSMLTLTMAACLYTIAIDTYHSQLYVYQLFGGIGVGLYAMNAGPVMTAMVPEKDVHDASMVFGCVDTICSAISIGVANSIFVNRATDGIQDILPTLDRSVVQQAIAGVGASLTADLPEHQRQKVLQKILEAMGDVWVQIFATASLSFGLALMMRRQKLRERSES